MDKKEKNLEMKEKLEESYTSSEYVAYVNYFNKRLEKKTRKPFKTRFLAGFKTAEQVTFLCSYVALLILPLFSFPFHGKQMTFNFFLFIRSFVAVLCRSTKKIIILDMKKHTWEWVEKKWQRRRRKRDKRRRSLGVFCSPDICVWQIYHNVAFPA